MVFPSSDVRLNRAHSGSSVRAKVTFQRNPSYAMFASLQKRASLILQKINLQHRLWPSCVRMESTHCLLISVIVISSFTHICLGKGKVHQKGFVSKLGTVLIIITILVGMLNILPAKASVGTIFIDPNGLIVPSTAPIRRDGNVYTLTADITSDMDGIYIGRNNVVLDGSSHTICGPMGYVGVGMGYQTNVTIRNMGISGFWYGLNLYGCREIKVVGNNITNMVNYGCAINALSAKNNTVQNNVISDTATGVWFSSSSDNTVSGNVFTDNTIAVRLDWSSGNSVLANNIAGNSQGIELEGSSGNSIVGNSIDGNGVGIRLVQSSGNTVTGNHITNQNVTGLVLNTSSKNLIYHNNFINSQQVSSYDSESVWDDGYPSGGNYWSEYNGTDLFSGPCQNETGNDGIGDTPYPVDSDSQDSFPVMNLWASTVCLYPFMAQTEEDATFTVNVMAFHVQDLWAWQTGLVWDPTALEYVSCTWGEFQQLAGNSCRSSPETDNLTGKTSMSALESALRGSSAPVSAQMIKLLAITFKAVKNGTSELRLADVSLVGQNQTDTRTYSRWSDADGDGVVDDDDVGLTRRCWEQDQYNQAVDFNGDDKVDITDVSIVTGDYGKTLGSPEWGVTNTVSRIQTATVGAHVSAWPREFYISVPYHAQPNGYYCGPASLEMVFDFYGVDIPQIEIADVERTSFDGTYTFDMVRAAHFSNMSTSVGRASPLNFTGYSSKVGLCRIRTMGLDDRRSQVHHMCWLSSHSVGDLALQSRRRIQQHPHHVPGSLLWFNGQRDIRQFPSGLGLLFSLGTRGLPLEHNGCQSQKRRAWNGFRRTRDNLVPDASIILNSESISSIRCYGHNHPTSRPCFGFRTNRTAKSRHAFRRKPSQCELDGSSSDRRTLRDMCGSRGDSERVCSTHSTPLPRS